MATQGTENNAGSATWLGQQPKDEPNAGDGNVPNAGDGNGGGGQLSGTAQKRSLSRSKIPRDAKVTRTTWGLAEETPAKEGHENKGSESIPWMDTLRRNRVAIKDGDDTSDEDVIKTRDDWTEEKYKVEIERQVDKAMLHGRKQTRCTIKAMHLSTLMTQLKEDVGAGTTTHKVGPPVVPPSIMAAQAKARPGNRDPNDFADARQLAKVEEKLKKAEEDLKASKGNERTLREKVAEGEGRFLGQALRETL